MLENQVKPIYLAIGSNLGNKKRNIENTKLNLLKNNINILECSSYYESLSWPNPKNPKFLNIVVKIKTHLTPLKLIKKCKEIEIRLGRKIYASLDSNEFKITRYFKKLLFEKKGNFFGEIFNLDDDEISINLYYDEDVVIDLLNKF